MNKKLLLALLAGTFLSVGTVQATEVAQPDSEPAVVREQGKRPEFDKDFQKKMAEKIAKDLNLTEDQIAQAEKLREESRAKIKPMMDEMSALREKIDLERRANMEAFENILTDEQKENFKRIREEGPRHFKGKMMRGMHHSPDEGEMLPPPDGPREDMNDRPEDAPRMHKGRPDRRSDHRPDRDHD